MHAAPGQAVFLCASYYSYERWSQDAVRMAKEVGGCVFDKVLFRPDPLAVPQKWRKVAKLDPYGQNMMNNKNNIQSIADKREEDFGHGLLY